MIKSIDKPTIPKNEAQDRINATLSWLYGDDEEVPPVVHPVAEQFLSKLGLDGELGWRAVRSALSSIDLDVRTPAALLAAGLTEAQVSEVIKDEDLMRDSSRLFLDAFKQSTPVVTSTNGHTSPAQMPIGTRQPTRSRSSAQSEISVLEDTGKEDDGSLTGISVGHTNLSGTIKSPLPTKGKSGQDRAQGPIPHNEPPAEEMPQMTNQSLRGLTGISQLGRMLSIKEDESWQDGALCAQTDPEAFFPEKGGSTREAKKVCANCEVRRECLDYAVENDERFGVWGGLSERERRVLKKRTTQ